MNNPSHATPSLPAINQLFLPLGKRPGARQLLHPPQRSKGLRAEKSHEMELSTIIWSIG